MDKAVIARLEKDKTKIIELNETDWAFFQAVSELTEAINKLSSNLRNLK